MRKKITKSKWFWLFGTLIFLLLTSTQGFLGHYLIYYDPVQWLGYMVTGFVIAFGGTWIVIKIFRWLKPYKPKPQEQSETNNL